MLIGKKVYSRLTNRNFWSEITPIFRSNERAIVVLSSSALAQGGHSYDKSFQCDRSWFGYQGSIMRLLHECDLRRCFRNSGSVTYVSTPPSPALVPWCPLCTLCTLPSSSGQHLILRATVSYKGTSNGIHLTITPHTNSWSQRLRQGLPPRYTHVY